MVGQREPAVAGTFYPAEPASLRAAIRGYLESAERLGGDQSPKALIAPHAGYVYSGPIAASAYARLRDVRRTIQRVVLLGPAHFVPCAGLAASRAQAFATPLGAVPVDSAGLQQALALPQVQVFDQAHRREHSLEVHLPFLQEVLPEFTLVPLAVGRATPEEVGQVLLELWGGPETLILVSSDLSHYEEYQRAKQLDALTARAIEELRLEEVGDESACGAAAIRGLLHAARQRGLRATTVDLRNSGDTAGSRDLVVGYGAFIFEG